MHDWGTYAHNAAPPCWDCYWQQWESNFSPMALAQLLPGLRTKNNPFDPPANERLLFSAFTVGRL